MFEHTHSPRKIFTIFNKSVIVIGMRPTVIRYKNNDGVSSLRTYEKKGRLFFFRGSQKEKNQEKQNREIGRCAK